MQVVLRMAARFEPNLKRTFEMAFCETNEPKDVFIAIVKSVSIIVLFIYLEVVSVDYAVKINCNCKLVLFVDENGGDLLVL